MKTLRFVGTLIGVWAAVPSVVSGQVVQSAAEHALISSPETGSAWTVGGADPIAVPLAVRPSWRGLDVARLIPGSPVEASAERSRVTYPLAGAVVGGLAGALYASIRYSGENALGWPVEPVYIFVPVGALAGALAGAIIDPQAQR